MELKKQYIGVKYHSTSMNKQIVVKESNLSIIIKDNKKEFLNDTNTKRSSKPVRSNGKGNDNSIEPELPV